MKFCIMTLSVVLSCSAYSAPLNPGEKILIQDLGFDPQSKEFQIRYSSPNSYAVTTLKDSGSLYLCVVDQLLKEYYRRMSSHAQGQVTPEFSKKHLKLLSQVAATIPVTKSSKIKDSLRTYIQNFRTGGGPVLESLRETILELLKDHQVSLTEETIFNPEDKKKLENEITLLNSNIEQLRKQQEGSSYDMKLLLARSYEGKLKQLKEDLKNFPQKKSKQEKKISALESIFCASTLPPFSLLNPDVGALLDKLTEEVKGTLPSEKSNRADSTDTHF